MKIPKGMKKADQAKDTQEFIGIEKKIAKRFGQVVILSCVILGLITGVLNYVSSINAIDKSIQNMSDIAADYVSASLSEYIAIAYETGSIARLADAEKSVEEKSAILQQRIKDHDFETGFLLDSNGIDVISGVDLSDKDYFKEGMKGNTYVSTPAYSQVTDEVSFAVSAPLWDNGIPGTTPVGEIGRAHV